MVTFTNFHGYLSFFFFLFLFFQDFMGRQEENWQTPALTSSSVTVSVYWVPPSTALRIVKTGENQGYCHGLLICTHCSK